MQVDDVIQVQALQRFLHFRRRFLDGVHVVDEGAEAFHYRRHVGLGQKVDFARTVNGLTQARYRRCSEHDVPDGGEANDEYACRARGHGTKLPMHNEDLTLGMGCRSNFAL